MDFLSKALEKAKAGQKPEQAAPQPAPRIPPPEPAPLTAGPGVPLGEIAYTVTRTVAVNPEHLKSRRLVTASSEDPAGEAYKLLRTQVVQRTRADNQNLLMVTGPHPGEGKTLTAINLAVSLAQEVDKTVLLVDADLRRPTVHDYFGLPPGPGLVDYLTGEKTIPELLVHPQGFAKFVLLPGGRPVDKAAELVSSPMMAELVEELKHFYPDRYVLFDLPPLLSYADALAFAPLVDAIILVVEQGKTTREDVQRCLELLKDFRVLGTVLNKVVAKTPGYYYPPNYRSHDQQPETDKGFWKRLKTRFG